MIIPLQINDITKKFGGHTAVNGLSLQVQPGEIFGLLGGNGAGKTTTMRMSLGIIKPDQGSILWNGKKYDGDTQNILGYLPEERGLYPKVRVSEQINYLARLKGIKSRTADQRLKEWLEKFEVPEYYNKRVEELSKGNQQKIQFIAAVIHQPEILVLDEAFSGLDPVNVELLKKTVIELRDAGTAILFSTHRMEHVEELCRNVCILHRSNAVLRGNLREIKDSFPKEWVKIETMNGQQLYGLEKITGVRNVQQTDNYYKLQIDRPEVAQEILREALSQTSIRQFELLEPTLNEIFIKTVGERHE